MGSSLFVLTAGKGHTDVDALACACAYQELLQHQGHRAEVVFTAPYDATVTNTIKSWPFTVQKLAQKHKKGAHYILVDISDPAYFSSFVNPEKITEVIDHRAGFEVYWHARLGAKAQIELVGACATLVWERVKAAGFENKLTEVSKKLLYVAILSNTLALKSSNTTPRDRAAYAELAQSAAIPPGFDGGYYESVGRAVLTNPLEALRVDKKHCTIKGQNYAIGQLELWSPQSLLADPAFTLGYEEVFAEDGPLWFVNLPYIEKGFNYILTPLREVQALLEKAVGAEFRGPVGVTKSLFLRKEIEAILRAQS